MHRRKAPLLLLAVMFTVCKQAISTLILSGNTQELIQLRCPCYGIRAVLTYKTDTSSPCSPSLRWPYRSATRYPRSDRRISIRRSRGISCSSCLRRCRRGRWGRWPRYLFFDVAALRQADGGVGDADADGQGA
ncbi:hypothetical protein BU26DRAFT_282124 [Trematosphaeria pertusa]|uniref:Uncharacterized protein n=1 Tax=Trematosphaeria pertusa TaxID=390896 RepID=A0A6A6ILT1_9PLEO|nr:uncharacterized protein BU26DRAFT_282124 [Trematosphaeria pertusa]KAF2251391.1 hypothetical protein BU26DRAFT_282124 [Trematosphaeria pertusa]